MSADVASTLAYPLQLSPSTLLRSKSSAGYFLPRDYIDRLSLKVEVRYYPAARVPSPSLGLVSQWSATSSSWKEEPKLYIAFETAQPANDPSHRLGSVSTRETVEEII
jgi:hypothetical protein